MNAIKRTLLTIGLGLSLCLPAFAAIDTSQASSRPLNADNSSQGMIITGDQEMPQVLYIIPWQEQRAAVPIAPSIKYPIQQPLTPCDTDQALTNYQADLWNCQPKTKSLSR